jgi:hypothetical protein
MPKTKIENNKKHGDVLEPLIDRTLPNRSQGSAELQDDDDEDVQNDDREDRRDVDERK